MFRYSFASTDLNSTSQDKKAPPSPAKTTPQRNMSSNQKKFMPLFADNDEYEYEITPPTSPVHPSAGKLLLAYPTSHTNFFQHALAFVRVPLRHGSTIPTALVCLFVRIRSLRPPLAPPSNRP